MGCLIRYPTKESTILFNPPSFSLHALPLTTHPLHSPAVSMRTSSSSSSSGNSGSSASSTSSSSAATPGNVFAASSSSGSDDEAPQRRAPSPPRLRIPPPLAPSRVPTNATAVRVLDFGARPAIPNNNDASTADQRDPATSCPVCFRELVEPKVLSCLHNLCSECERTLTKEVQSRRRNRAGELPPPKRQVKCPICNQTTVVKEGGLKINFGMRGELTGWVDWWVHKLFQNPLQTPCKF